MKLQDPALALKFQFQCMCHIAAGTMSAPIKGWQYAPKNSEADTARLGCRIRFMSG